MRVVGVAAMWNLVASRNVHNDTRTTQDSTSETVIPRWIWVHSAVERRGLPQKGSASNAGFLEYEVRRDNQTSSNTEFNAAYRASNGGNWNE